MSAIVEHRPEPQSDVTAIIQAIERAVVNPNVDIDKMERLFALQERMLTRSAEIAFNEAMRATQAEMPKIKRNKKNNQTGSLYADLEAVTDAAAPIYTRNGFSLSFGEGDSAPEGKTRILCWCSHTAGHTRQYKYDASLDATGLKGNANKTAIQAEGSTFSYGQRYLTKLIFNITLTDEDNDGQSVAKQPDAPKGYENWRADMAVFAEEGTEKLQGAWSNSQPEFRRYVVKNDEAWWNETKRKASRAAK